MAKNTDWVAIETEYRGTNTPVSQIAKTHGITEGAIRAKAKKQGWVRDNGKLKRSLVASKLDGITPESTNYEVRKLIEEHANQDVVDMQRGVRVARAGMIQAEVLIGSCEDARQLKTLVEANQVCVNTIRKIRGLDEDVGVDDSKVTRVELVAL